AGIRITPTAPLSAHGPDRTQTTQGRAPPSYLREFSPGSLPDGAAALQHFLQIHRGRGLGAVATSGVGHVHIADVGARAGPVAAVDPVGNLVRSRLRRCGRRGRAGRADRTVTESLGSAVALGPDGLDLAARR